LCIRLQQLYPDDYNFHPISWRFPAEVNAFKKSARFLSPRFLSAGWRQTLDILRADHVKRQDRRTSTLTLGVILFFEAYRKAHRDLASFFISLKVHVSVLAENGKWDTMANFWRGDSNFTF
jgi:hypothetical protein